MSPVGYRAGSTVRTGHGQLLVFARMRLPRARALSFDGAASTIAMIKGAIGEASMVTTRDTARLVAWARRSSGAHSERGRARARVAPN